MTTPADDCGVTGGCRACPLFAADVCGDPAPVPGDVRPYDLARFAVTREGVALDMAGVEAVDPDAPDVDPDEPKPEGAGCCGGACGG